MSKERVRDWRPDVNAGMGKKSNLGTEGAPMPEFEPVNKPTSRRQLDDWSDTAKLSRMCCCNCLYFLNMRCRRRAPKADYGYPMVFESDWCGDMKSTKRSMGGH